MKKLTIYEQMDILKNRIDEYKGYTGKNELATKLENALIYYIDHCEDLDLTREEMEVSFLLALLKV